MYKESHCPVYEMIDIWNRSDTVGSNSIASNFRELRMQQTNPSWTEPMIPETYYSKDSANRIDTMPPQYSL